MSDEEENTSQSWWTRLKSIIPKWLKILLRVIEIVLIAFGLFQLIVYVKSCSSENREKAREERKVRILVPLYATEEEYRNFMDMEEGAKIKFTNLNKFSSFSKKVSRDVMNSIDQASKEWFAGRRSSNDKGLADNHVDFYFFPEGYSSDTASYKSALSKALKESFNDGFEIAGLIGNITSSATIEYGKIIGGIDEDKSNNKGICAELNIKDGRCGKFPMILPLSTAANVPQTLRNSGVESVLRLPPDNKKQAELLADFLLNRSDKPILKSVIVKDLSNKSYSSDLVESFLQNYVQNPLDRSQKSGNGSQKKNEQAVFGSVLTTIPSGGEQGNIPIFSTIEKLKPEAVLVFGMTDISLDTISQINASSIKPKYIILTDGAVDEYLLPKIKPISYLKSSIQIYLSFPLNDPNPASVTEITKNLPIEDKKNLEMTHSVYVIDSVYILLELLNEGIFKDKNLDMTNKMMNEKVRNLYQESKKNSGIKVPSNISYAFDTFGNSTGLEYNLYRMCFSGLPNCPSEKEYEWQKVTTLFTNVNNINKKKSLK